MERRASTISSGSGIGAGGGGGLCRRDDLYKRPEAGQLDVLKGRQEASVAGAQ